MNWIFSSSSSKPKARVIFLVIAELLSLALLNLTPAQADSANPPKIISAQILNKQNSYAAGDEIALSITYSGGSPGLSSAGIYLRPRVEGSTCFGNSNAFGWQSNPRFAYSKENYGPINSSTIILYSTINSGCVKGTNVFDYDITLKDKTDLTDFVMFYPTIGLSGMIDNRNISINVSDGEYVPVGTMLNATPKDLTLDLSTIKESYVLERNKTVQLPKKTNEGILVNYFSWSENCTIQYDFTGQISNVLRLDAPGKCEVQASTNVSRSNYNSLSKRFSISVLSQAAIDKAAADKAAADKAAADKAAADKAAADKAAADKAAADKAAADNAKSGGKSISCVKGKSVLKVIGNKPKCPAGYKKK